MVQSIANRLGGRPARKQLDVLLLEPGAQVGDERGAVRLPVGAAFVGAAAADLRLDAYIIFYCRSSCFSSAEMCAAMLRQYVQI